MDLRIPDPSEYRSPEAPFCLVYGTEDMGAHVKRTCWSFPTWPLRPQRPPGFSVPEMARAAAS